MGEVYYKDPSGRTRGFRIAGAEPTPEEEQRIAARLSPQPAQPQTAPETSEPGILSALGSGIAKGWNSSQSGLDRMAQLASLQTGYFGGYSTDEWGKAAEEQTKEGGTYYAPEGGFFEQDGLYAKTRFLANVAGQTIPSTVAGIGAGAATGNPLVGLAVGSASYLPQSLDETTQAQIQQHGKIKDWGKAVGGAALNSVIEGASDQVTAGLAGAFKTVAKPLLREAATAGVQGAYKVMAKKIGAAAAVDAIKGASEEVLQSIVTRAQAEMPLADEAAQRDYIESAVVGGLLEGVMGAGAGGVAAREKIKEDSKIRQLRADVEERARGLVENRKAFEEKDIPLRQAKFKDTTTETNIPDLGPEKETSPSVWRSVVEREELKNAPFTEDEYKKTIQTLSDEKLISVDKIKKKVGVDAGKAKAIYTALAQRGDAALSATTNKYLRIVNPADKPAGVETKHIGAPSYRSYQVTPVEPGFEVVKNGQTIGVFKAIEEAQNSIDQNKLVGASIQKKDASRYGVYEIVSKKRKTGETEIAGKRLVGSYPTETEAKSQAQKLDPQYSPTTNALFRKTTEAEQADMVAADILNELGDQTRILQQMADSLIGKGRADVNVVPSIGEQELRNAGVPEGSIPSNISDMAVEGVTTKTGFKSLITLAQDVASPEMDPTARQAKLSEVLGHEIVHAIRNSDLLTEQEWDVLLDAAVNDKVPGKRYTWTEWVMANNPEMPANIVAEEAIAEMVRAHLSNPMLLKPAPRGIIAKIVAFLKRLGRVAQGKRAEEVIELIRGGGLVSRKTGHGGLGPRGYPGDPMFAMVPVDGFFLKSYRAIENSDRLKASPEEWLAILRKSGVKQEEMDWLGLNEAMRAEGKSIQKGVVLDYIKANSIRIYPHEVQRGGNLNIPDHIKDVLNDLDIELNNISESTPLPSGKTLVGLFMDEWQKERGFAYGDEPANMLNDPYSRPEDGDTSGIDPLFEDMKSHFVDYYVDDVYGKKRSTEEIELINKFVETINTFNDFSSEYEVSKPLEYEGVNQEGITGKVEFTLHLPHIEDGYDSAHWKDNHNVVAHVRAGERSIKNTETGRSMRVLDIQEIQSDWHQAGRQRGYKYELTETADTKALVESEGSDLVPNAPFKKTWDELAFKRMIRYAAENNFDGISFNATPEGVMASEKWGHIEPTILEDGDIRYKAGDVDVTGIIRFQNKVLRDKASEIIKKFGGKIVYHKYEQKIDRHLTPKQIFELRSKTGHFDKWVMPITKEMRNFFLNEGMPLFSAALKQPMYSANAPMGQRVPPSPPKGTLADVEAGLRYNNLAPALQKLSRFVPRKWRVEYEDRVESTLVQLQDRMLPMGKLIDRVRKNGGFVSTESDPYLRETLLSGRIDSAILENSKKFYEPIANVVKALPVTDANAMEAADINEAARVITTNYVNDSPQLALAELYLYAQHAIERNAVIRERNTNLQNERAEQHDHGSGMMDSEATEILNWFRTKPFGKRFYDINDPTSLRSVFRALIKNTNAVRRQGGLIPAVFADENGNPVNDYEDYAPLRSFVDEHNEDMSDEDSQMIARTGKGFKIHGKEDISALGRRSIGSHLIAHAFLQNEEALIRSEKNGIGQSFLRLLEENPRDTKDVAQVIGRTKLKYAYDSRTGQVRRVNDPGMRNDPMVMAVKRDGEEVWIQFADAKLAKTMTSPAKLNSIGADAVMKWLLKMNRFFAAMRTSHNPEFLISNLMRDLQTAMINISENDAKGIATEVAKNVIPALSGLRDAIRKNDFSGEWGKTYKDFQKYGGQTAFLGIKDLENTLDKMNAMLANDYSGSDPRRVLKALGAVKDFVDDYNLIIENGIRLSTFKSMKERYLAMGNGSPTEIKRANDLAARAAKEVTVNFNRRGEMGPVFNALYLFYNAGIQGSLALINPMIRSKKVRRIWMGILTAGMVQDALMAFLSPEDDDGVKTYDKIPDYILEHNMVFIDPFGLTDRGYFKIPLPYLMNGVFNAGRNASQIARGGIPMADGLGSMGRVLFESMSPLGQMNSFLNFVSPTITDPIVDLTINKTFSGAPIMPAENPYGQTERASQRYWNNTSPAYISVADWIAKLTGGSGDYMDGLVEVSPNQIDYMLNFITGGVGTFLVRSWDFVAPEALGGKSVAYDIVSGGEWTANDFPFVRRIFGNVSSREDMQFYIENRDRVLRIKAELDSARKAGDVERYREVMGEYKSDYAIVGKINKIEAARRKLSAQINKITRDPKIPADKKAKLIEELKKKQQELIGVANSLFRSQ